jgi:hypothetical protein
MPRPALSSTVRRALVGAVAGVLATAALTTLGGSGPADAEGAAATASAARKANVVTPGDFTGYGFDQCHAPEQAKMNRWLQYSPFLAVGIYISGDSRACREQPNLTPAWISTQLAKGWRLLPITLGPQASCQPRFPRYDDDVKINPKPGASGRYSVARKQGNNEAIDAVDVATGLGIAPGSTLWYDLEGFELANTRCRESALAFLSGWTWQLHQLGWVSGVYSSAGSGIKMLDDARVNRPDAVVLPDQIWVARWDGKANTTTSYLRPDGWHPHARVKQYQGGHDETWGGITINIDRNFVDLGRGSVAVPETHCGGIKIGYGLYPTLKPATTTVTPPPAKVKALQCLLQEQGLYAGKVNGLYTTRTVKAANAWQATAGFEASTTWSKRNWMSLLSAGDRPVAKYGSTGPAVRRVQRTLNAVTDRDVPVKATGIFDARTTDALKAWQKFVGLDVTGVANQQTWNAFAHGKIRR